MDKEMKTIVKKTVKIAGVTCAALGGAALIASGAALKAMTEGAKYLKNAIEKIVNEDAEAEDTVMDACAEEAGEAPAADTAEEEAVPVEEGMQEA